MFSRSGAHRCSLANPERHAVHQTFKLATSGWGIGAREDRSLFDRIFDGNITAFSGLDANVGWQPVDEGCKTLMLSRPYALHLANLKSIVDKRIVNHEKWVIPWLE